jgi:hypothetical protein
MSYLAQAAFPLIWMVVPCVGALVRTCRVRDRAERREIRRWWAIGALGFGSLWMTFSFLAIPDAMAEAIGFTRISVTFEIAFANLGLALLGLLAASASYRERMTIGLSSGMFLRGAVIGHLYQWIANGDHAPGQRRRRARQRHPDPGGRDRARLAVPGGGPRRLADRRDHGFEDQSNAPCDEASGDHRRPVAG